MNQGQWRIGEVTVTRVVEIEATGGMTFILPQAKRDILKEIPWLYPHFADENGRMRGSIHALIIETPDRRIVVDTCIGNDKERGNPPWNQLQTTFLEDLTAAGYPRDSIDNVLCTHLHVDHVGWNTMLVDGKWQPTFPKARYLMGRAEFEHWRGFEEAATQQVMSDSVLPVFDAGLVDLVETDHKICDQVSLIPTVGHSPGHVSVLIQSQGEEALITGDFIHHPCQMAHPEWSASVDSDPEQARRTRNEVFARYADTPTLIIGTHFHTPTAGHLKRDGDVYRLDV
ncbi:MAG: MBL fold metallo-hydrolase [Rhodospirillaceae bacterium]|jgi:glyoxylase-like metal-dependent hydrolase (beta-lactamase superfamily II)|nr:MBL fold metallo-hydrolase [Rhodospirillaceae bacterium]MBT4691162.1 MBL fold metallo-hydrolase [Rhodospirillaceae bacterium]MBT5080885.1 MBL fold metallo-hydrolase [Rhodospirillaceae bacterium]MBT5525306.1 MBL fold metallo-hydrolase [Rhodospirillaceae bacterium]MBT5877875.1 MBL fold metallo-hydrolase [Rhodospirillaceae bacterium]